MGGSRIQRSVWEDRFSQPTETEVLSHYTRQLRGCAESVRAVMAARAEIRESLEWMGVPWRWTFVYRREGLASRSDAYLVPFPAGPRWVLAVPTEIAAHLPLRALPRIVRDAFASATRVGSQVWPQWDIQTKAQVQEVAGVLDAIASGEAVSA